MTNITRVWRAEVVGGQSAAEDVFSMFFGGGGGAGRRWASGEGRVLLASKHSLEDLPSSRLVFASYFLSLCRLQGLAARGELRSHVRAVTDAVCAFS
jgi:hypothetical protein